MLPSAYKEIDEEEEFEVVSEPSKTYRLDVKTKRISGFCDGIEAIQQAVYKILNTERYRALIYDWYYGFEKEDLIGICETESYVFLKISQRIREALLEDDRIEDIEDFWISREKEKVIVTFQVVTIIGSIEIKKEIGVNV